MGPTRLSWTLTSQTDVDLDHGFEVTVTRDSTGELLLNQGTGRNFLIWDGATLQSRDRCSWTVRGRDRRGEEMSARATFETGLASTHEWSAQWRAAPVPEHTHESWNPAAYLRREFSLPRGEVSVGRVYATALGVYRLWLNGVELTENSLYRPGWTDYRRRLYHQTYDCTALLREGQNVVAATVAAGWYAGRLGLLREPAFYGDHTALLLQIEADSAEGLTVIATDEHWRASSGAILASDLLRGELQDLRREPCGWKDIGFDDRGWAHAEGVIPPDALVEPQPHDSIGVFHVHPGTLVREHGRGPAVFDFGQNIVGWTRLSSRYLPSVELIVRHGEMLTPENLVYRDNLRGAFQEDRYVVPDGEHRTLEPAFGMHGFRYAEVWGLPSDQPFGALKLLPDSSIEAVSVTGLPTQVGYFSCSDERLTRLAANVEWTVRDNFLEVMTDCPQREERHGWLGDAGVISPTAAYIFDISSFAAKFAHDAADSQGSDGEIRSWVPACPPADSVPGAPGWADGYIRIVHLLVERYGDLVTASRLFDSMAAFLDHIDRANPDGLRTREVGSDFGDWLSLPDREGYEVHPGYAWTGSFLTTPKPIVDTAHSFRSFVQMAEISARLGRTSEAGRYHTRAAQIRDAYRTAFVAADGTITDATQTAYAQAVGFGLLNGHDAQRAADHLRRMIETTGYVTTGIHGVEHVLPVLSAFGHADLALSLLFRDEMPSWLYMVASGATTIWEKWDAIRPDGSLATAEMNSLNHCALGAVGRFLYEGVAGIDATTTAWDREVRIRCASYDQGLDWARASYNSPVGEIRSHWRRSGEAVVHELLVPGGTTARFAAPVGWTIDAADDRPAGTEAIVGPGLHALTLLEGTR